MHSSINFYSLKFYLYLICLPNVTPLSSRLAGPVKSKPGRERQTGQGLFATSKLWVLVASELTHTVQPNSEPEPKAMKISSLPRHRESLTLSPNPTFPKLPTQGRGLPPAAPRTPSQHTGCPTWPVPKTCRFTA